MSELAVGSLKGLAANSFVIDVASGSSLTQPGMIVAVKHALFTGTQVASSVAAGGNVAVTDLSITHEVANASNKLIISAFLGIAATTGQRGNAGIAIHDGTGLIGVNAAPGSRTNVSAGGYTDSAASAVNVSMPSVTFVHTPGTGSKTYTVRIVNIRDASSDLFVNRMESDDDDAARARAVSSLVIQEVAV